MGTYQNELQMRNLKPAFRGARALEKKAVHMHACGGALSLSTDYYNSDCYCYCLLLLFKGLLSLL